MRDRLPRTRPEHVGQHNCSLTPREGWPGQADETALSFWPQLLSGGPLTREATTDQALRPAIPHPWVVVCAPGWSPPLAAPLPTGVDPREKTDMPPYISKHERARGGYAPPAKSRRGTLPWDDWPALPTPDQSRYGSATTDPLGREGPGWTKGKHGLPVRVKGDQK